MAASHANTFISPDSVSRRGFLTLAAGGLGGIALAGGSLTAADAADTASPAPKLPGEYYRKTNQRTVTGTLFDNINVRINGDVARIFVPQTAKPGSGVPVPVVWFYHGSGSDHNALEGGFKTAAHAVVDRGSIAICQTAGGTLYSHPTAVALQVAGFEYMRGLFTIATNVLRSTSGGGALGTETYARQLITNVAGMYVVNGSYDLRAHYEAGGRQTEAMQAVFGDPASIDAANPARHGSSAWTGKRMRIVVSAPDDSDEVVPPAEHGLALRATALPTAREATLRTHTSGHNTPSWSVTDFVATMNSWGVPDQPIVVDTVAPVVSIISPSAGAVLSGVVTARVSATDNVGVVDVSLFAGSLRLATAVEYSASEWQVTFDTRGRANGTFTITAKAADAAGNIATSTGVRVTIRN